MNQQIRIHFLYDNDRVSLKEPDPRAIQFLPYHKTLIDGKKKSQIMDYDLCNPNELKHLNMA